MLMVGILGLFAMGSGIYRLVVTTPIQMRDLVLTGIGLFASILGFFQAYKLSGQGQED